MKNIIVRLITIFLLGMLVYFRFYEDDELGLSAFLAHVCLVGFTFIISIPIIFIKNKSRLSNKIGLVILSLTIATITPSLGIGKLKYMLEDSLYNREVQKVSEQFNVELQNNSISVPNGRHLLVDNGDGTLSVFDSHGKEVNKTDISKLAKEAVPNLPLADEQKSTTYYDGYTPQKLSYNLLKKIEDNKISFTFRYVTTEVPDEYTPEPDLPTDAKDIQFHYHIIFTPSLDENGAFIFDSNNYKKENDYLVSYKGFGIEAIVGPAKAKLVSELK